MINLKKFKLRNFLQLDLRWKLIRVGKHLGINVYPVFFSWKGFAGLYNKFILYIVFKSLTSEKKKTIFEEIERISKKTNKKKFLISPPASGTNYLRGVISSYCELYYKIGNGIPKYNSLTNKWIFSFSPFKRDTLFHQLNAQVVKEKFRDKFISDEEFQDRMIIFSRHPFINCDLFEFEFEKKMILIREPISWIISRYTQFEKNNFYEEGKINKKLIKDELNRLNEFILFWKNYIHSKREKLIILKFEELIKDPKKNVIKVLKFFGYDIDYEDIINRSIEINSKEFTLNNLGVNFTGTRFKDAEIKKKNYQKISHFVEQIIRDTNIMNNYNELISYTNE